MVAVVSILTYAIWRLYRSGFSWAEFAASFRHADWSWLILSGVLILATYVGRALRWEVMLRPLRKDASLWRIFTATAIGFTAVVLFGRAGEPVRPYLIGKNEGVSFSSQMAAWIVERILDLLMVLLIFGIALTQVSHSAMEPGPRTRVVLQTGGYVAGFFGAACLAILIGLRQFRAGVHQRLLRVLSFLPERILTKIQSILASFEEGMQSTRSAWFTLLLIAYTVVEWLVIAAAYYCFFKAFPSTVAFTPTDVVIVLGFVAFGSAVQIPGVGGGMQFVAVLVLTELFGLGVSIATGIAVILWVMSFVTIVPFGLALAFHEGIKWRSLRHIEQTEGSAS
jgi:uncharacterized protein (TIRG00374 family)